MYGVCQVQRHRRREQLHNRALSAKTDNRPNFQRMIKDSYKGLFDVVLVWKLDRFARRFRYGESFEIRRLQNVLHASPALPKFVTFFKNRAAMTSAQGLRAPHVSRRNALRGVSDTAAGVCSKDLFHILPFFAFIVSSEKTFRCKKTVR